MSPACGGQGTLAGKPPKQMLHINTNSHTHTHTPLPRATYTYVVDTPAQVGHEPMHARILARISHFVGIGLPLAHCTSSERGKRLRAMTHSSTARTRARTLPRQGGAPLRTSAPPRAAGHSCLGRRGARALPTLDQVSRGRGHAWTDGQAHVQTDRRVVDRWTRHVHLRMPTHTYWCAMQSLTRTAGLLVCCEDRRRGRCSTRWAPRAQVFGGGCSRAPPLRSALERTPNSCLCSEKCARGKFPW